MIDNKLEVVCTPKEEALDRVPVGVEERAEGGFVMIMIHHGALQLWRKLWLVCGLLVHVCKFTKREFVREACWRSGDRSGVYRRMCVVTVLCAGSMQSGSCIKWVCHSMCETVLDVSCNSVVRWFG